MGRNKELFSKCTDPNWINEVNYNYGSVHRFAACCDFKYYKVKRVLNCDPCHESELDAVIKIWEEKLSPEAIKKLMHKETTTKKEKDKKISDMALLISYLRDALHGEFTYPEGELGKVMKNASYKDVMTGEIIDPLEKKGREDKFTGYTVAGEMIFDDEE